MPNNNYNTYYFVIWLLLVLLLIKNKVLICSGFIRRTERGKKKNIEVRVIGVPDITAIVPARNIHRNSFSFKKGVRR